MGLLPACNLSIAEETDPPLPNQGLCHAICAYKADQGCGESGRVCELLCLIGYATASAEGECSDLAVGLQDCLSSRPVLDLGCSPSQEQQWNLCGGIAIQLEQCRQNRGCTAPCAMPLPAE